MEQRSEMQRVGCPHSDHVSAGRICLHLHQEKDSDYFQRFTGAGLTYDLVCSGCAKEPDSIDDRLIHVCSACLQAVEGGAQRADGRQRDHLGGPEGSQRPEIGPVRHEVRRVPVVGAVSAPLQPRCGARRGGPSA